jgi:phage shock protein A
MIKTLALLMRGAIADNAQAIHDANAVAILRQQIRDAAAALAGARREFAVVMAYHAAEMRALDALQSRIDTLSESARKALADGREDLAGDAAVLIAALEDERADRQTAMGRFANDIERLKALVSQAQSRLRDLDRGLQTARATEAVRRAGINGRRVVALSSGALADAEQTLARLRERHHSEDDFGEALASLEAEAASDVEARLKAEGYGSRRTDPQTVLDRLRASK